MAITLYRGTSGHTSMPSNTENGKLQSGVCNYLKDREQGFIHVTKKWKMRPGLHCELGKCSRGSEREKCRTADYVWFFAWSKFLIPAESREEIMFYKVPNPQCCFRGPPNSNNWKISNCHSLNLGYGEDSTGAMVNHPGVWFARYVFYQAVPHGIICRQPAVMEEETWRKARKSEWWLVRPW